MRGLTPQAKILGYNMLIGVPKEIKIHEYRVGMVPANVREATSLGHRVLIETGAGALQGLADEDYRAAGATVVRTAQDVFADAELIVKVKEPQASEIHLLRSGQTIFTYLHLAPDPQLTQALLDAGVTAIAYETVTSDRGGLPLLTPMSEVAGRMAIQVGARCLEMAEGGRGVLLGGTASAAPAKVVVLGGGVAGFNAVRAAVGVEAQVKCLDINLDRLADLDRYFGAALITLLATHQAVEDAVLDADLVIGTVLVPGATTPKLIGTNLVKAMKRGSAIVDVSIDQGGCAETSRPTSHAKPTFIEHGVVHYCVTNMPGAVARTSTIALNNATLPFVLALAGKGVRAALREDPHLRNGLNIHAGKITHPAVAGALGLASVTADEAIG
jgi:alanine dehydrogenase